MYPCAPLNSRTVVQDAIGAAGGIRVVVEAMRQHPQDEVVQYYATFALQCLVKFHAANQVRGRWRLQNGEQKMRR